MTALQNRWVSSACTVACLACLTLVGGCSGGGGSSLQARLTAASYSGFPTQSVGPGGGFLPVAFRDEVITLTFSGPIDDNVFGGFKLGPSGAPRIYRGLSPNGTGTVAYMAYEQQAAAATAVIVRRNALVAPPLPNYVIGRHLSLRNTIVIDPRIAQANSLGMPGNVGYAPAVSHTFQITAGSGLTIGGRPVQPAGADLSGLPLLFSATTPGGVGLVFFATDAFSPDPIPPEVLEIRASSGAAGTATDPMSVTDGIEIVFSRLIDLGSIDILRNLRILNLDLSNPTPGGLPSLVAGSYSFQELDFQSIVSFAPLPGYGPGIGNPPTQGYHVAVRVGTFGVAGVPTLLGLPQGTPPSQLVVVNSLERIFETQPTPGAPSSVTIIESFADQSQFDGAASVPMSPASWAQAVVDPCSPTTAPGLGPHSGMGLQASRLCGDPLATTGNGGDPALLGTRKQFDLTQTVSATLFPNSPIGLVQPFDEAYVGGGPSTNPDGGSHLIQLFEDTDVGNSNPEPLHDSLELVEWGPTSNIVRASCYPSYQAWCGITSRCAPALITTGACQGLSFNYSANYDVATLQGADPSGLGGVLCSAIGAYIVSNQMATYMAFPVFNPVFDYDPNAGGTRHFLLEQNIEPASGLAPPPPPPNPPNCQAHYNVNRFVAGANFPVRRAFGPPLSLQLQWVQDPTLVAANFGGWDRYDWRFTWVNAVSTAQSKFYSLPSVPDPDYASVTIIPPPLLQTPGTASTWEFQGTDFLTPSGVPFGPTSPWVTWWDGPPFDPNNPSTPTGQFFPSSLDSLDGFQFVRFRVTMRANHLAPDGAGGFGTYQTYTGVIFNLTL